MPSLSCHLDDPLGHLVKLSLAATAGLGLQPKSLPVAFEPDVQLAPADAQLPADHLLAHATMDHPHSPAAKGVTVLLSRHCLGRKLPSDPGGDSTRTEVMGHRPRSGHPDGDGMNHTFELT